MLFTLREYEQFKVRDHVLFVFVFREILEIVNQKYGMTLIHQR